MKTLPFYINLNYKYLSFLVLNFFLLMNCKKDINNKPKTFNQSKEQNFEHEIDNFNYNKEKNISEDYFHTNKIIQPTNNNKCNNPTKSLQNLKNNVKEIKKIEYNINSKTDKDYQVIPINQNTKPKQQLTENKSNIYYNCCDDIYNIGADCCSCISKTINNCYTERESEVKTGWDDLTNFFTNSLNWCKKNHKYLSSQECSDNCNNKISKCYSKCIERLSYIITCNCSTAVGSKDIKLKLGGKKKSNI